MDEGNKMPIPTTINIKNVTVQLPPNIECPTKLSTQPRLYRHGSLNDR